MHKQYFSAFTKMPVLIAALFVALALPFLTLPEITNASMTNTRADAWNTNYNNAASWMTNNGGGVDVYSNGSTTDYRDCSGNIVSTYAAACKRSVNGVVSGAENQCVELFNRLYLTKGWISSTWTGYGNTLYNIATLPVGFSKEDSTHTTYINPGDAITFNDGGTGHVVMVDSISGSTVNVVSQNTQGVLWTVSWNTTTHTLTQTYLGSSYSVQGIIHRPTGGGGGSGSGNTSNLVKNGGFELGTANWTTMPGTNFIAYSNGQPTATDVAFSGTHFAATNAFQSNGSFYQDIPVTANAGDMFCADTEMRTQTGSPSPTVNTLGLFLLGGSVVDVGSHAYTNLPNDGSTWLNEKTCVTATVTQPTLRIQIFPEINGGTTDVDNIDVHKSLARNGGFDLNNAYWNSMPGTNFAIYSNGQPVSTDRAYSGTKFAATNAWQSNGSFYQDIPVTTTPGDTYCADAQMRTQTGSPVSAANTLGVFLLGGSTIDVGSHDFSGLPNDGSTWLNEKTCVTATVAQTTLRIQVYPQVNGTTVDVDNIDVHKSLARNGGFELNIAYWNSMPGTNFIAYSNGQPTATDKAYSGTKFAASNAFQLNGSFYQDIPVTANAGDEYCVDAQMRTQTGSPASTVDTLGVFLLGGSTVDAGTHGYTNLPNDGATWLNERTCVTATVAQTLLRIQVYPEVSGNTVNIDNIDVH